MDNLQQSLNDAEWERRAAEPSTNAAHTNARMAEDDDAIEAAEAANYEEHHVEWERDEWRERANRYEAALMEIITLESVDPDGIRWTWKDLFLEAQAKARLALLGVATMAVL